MSQKQRNIEIFSLSFLDMIFCAMAGILVLYTTARDNPGDESPPPPPNWIVVEVVGVDESTDIGILLKSGATFFECSTSGDTGNWTVRTEFGAASSLVQANILIDEELQSPTLAVFVRDSPRLGGAPVDEIQFFVTAIGNGFAKSGTRESHTLKIDEAYLCNITL